VTLKDPVARLLCACEIIITFIVQEKRGRSLYWVILTELVTFYFGNSPLGVLQGHFQIFKWILEHSTELSAIDDGRLDSYVTLLTSTFVEPNAKRKLLTERLLKFYELLIGRTYPVRDSPQSAASDHTQSPKTVHVQTPDDVMNKQLMEQLKAIYRQYNAPQVRKSKGPKYEPWYDSVIQFGTRKSDLVLSKKIGDRKRFQHIMNETAKSIPLTNRLSMHEVGLGVKVRKRLLASSVLPTQKGTVLSQRPLQQQQRKSPFPLGKVVTDSPLQTQQQKLGKKKKRLQKEINSLQLRIFMNQKNLSTGGNAVQGDARVRKSLQDGLRRYKQIVSRKKQELAATVSALQAGPVLATRTTTQLHKQQTEAPRSEDSPRDMSASQIGQLGKQQRKRMIQQGTSPQSTNGISEYTPPPVVMMSDKSVQQELINKQLIQKPEPDKDASSMRKARMKLDAVYLGRVNQQKTPTIIAHAVS
jgi:hypothetical protein